jgi:hypothetical protein
MILSAIFFYFIIVDYCSNFSDIEIAGILSINLSTLVLVSLMSY